jgi:HEAT repeat protein
LPESGEIDQRLGQIIAKPLSGPADELLALMEDPNNPDFLRAVQGFADATLEADEKTLNQHAARLKKLAGAANPEARIAAVKALAKARSLDNVPTLIYAMTDPDARVVAEAREGLRFVSRKLGPLPVKTVANPASGEEIDYWKAWFRSVRPDAEFEN